MTYTQMLFPDEILNDQSYFERHVYDLTVAGSDRKQPVIVQLCGHEPETIVQAGRKLQGYCDGIDLNLGCPQEAARDGHFGAYLLGQKDWPLVEHIVASMCTSFMVPVSTKLRLCQPILKTLELAQRLEAKGASWITLHARTVSARRRRQGAADLTVVQTLKSRLKVPIISNGNVRVFRDLKTNLEFTGADGVMVGESLLSNPCLFADSVPDPLDISLEYLGLCMKYPGTATIGTIQTHIRHFVESRFNRLPWFSLFRTALADTQTAEEVEKLLQNLPEQFYGGFPRYPHHGSCEDEYDKDVAGATEDTFDLSLLE